MVVFSDENADPDSSRLASAVQDASGFASNGVGHIADSTKLSRGQSKTVWRRFPSMMSKRKDLFEDEAHSIRELDYKEFERGHSQDAI